MLTELQVATKKMDQGWAVIINDAGRTKEFNAGHGFYLDSLCDGSTKPTPAWFDTREEAREAIIRYNELNAGEFVMVGGLH